MQSKKIVTLKNNSKHFDFIEELHNFEFNGNKPTIFESDIIPYYIGEFWTSKQRQGNPLHEISYRACFKPQLPEFFISRLTSVGDVVYDPFMGRGTTPLQAALMGRNAIGNDVNPLSAMLVQPRLNPPMIDEISDRLKAIDWDKPKTLNEELLAFYHRETLREIEALRLHFLGRELDNVDDWIRMVAINRLTGHSPGFFSVYSMPPNQAVSLKAQIKINEKRNQVPPRRNVSEIILKKSRSLLKGSEAHFGQGEQGEFHISSASNTPNIKTSSIDLVVTSPPFLDIVQYANDNWLRCWFARIEVKDVEITMHKKVESWSEFVRSTFKELARVVKSGGHVAFEVGEVRGGKVELDKLVLEAVKGLPFEALGVVVNTQNFTKTANCWGVANNSKGTNSNRIVVFRRG